MFRVIGAGSVGSSWSASAEVVTDAQGRARVIYTPPMNQVGTAKIAAGYLDNGEVRTVIIDVPFTSTSQDATAARSVSEAEAEAVIRIGTHLALVVRNALCQELLDQDSSAGCTLTPGAGTTPDQNKIEDALSATGSMGSFPWRRATP